MIVDLSKVIPEVSAQMHKPVSGAHSAFLNQQWIRGLQLIDTDFVERMLELGDRRPHLGAQLFARQIFRRKFSFSISFIR